jgi:hypothetical protein
LAGMQSFGPSTGSVVLSVGGVTVPFPAGTVVLA